MMNENQQLLHISLIVWFSVLAALALLGLTSCGASPSEVREGHLVLNQVTVVADPTYALAVDTCDEFRDAIIAREGTTYEEDRSAMDQINEVCDGIVAGFEALRDTQLTARAALASGLTAAAAEAIRGALALWNRLREMIPELMQLGRGGA